MSAGHDAVPANPPPGVRVSVIVLAYLHVDKLLRCIQSLQAHVSPDIPHEVIVLSNGVGVDALAELQRTLPGVRLLFSAVNLGFAGGCNRAVARARGQYIALLNDDAEIEPGWLEALLDSVELEPGVGAVGSRILRPDGSVQEAGSVIWNDGSAAGVGRDLPPGSTEYSYRRQVDYCSAASLLVPREVWNAVGGMDEGYPFAYYEDVDLCMTLRARGLKIIYEPRSRVRHTESSSTDLRFRGFLFRRNQRRFCARWPAVLAECEPPPPQQDWTAGIARAVHRARGCPRRILVVDDLYPEPSLGSGFPKALSVIEELAQFAAVSFMATSKMHADSTMLQRLGVEVVHEPLDAHVRRAEVLYSAIVISRPHNFENWAVALRRWQPQAPIVYDAEALFHLRLVRQATVSGDPAIAAEATLMQKLEERIAVEADHIVCISEVEAEVMRAVPGHAPVDVVEPRRLVGRWTETGFFERRNALLVAGWLAGPTSPNADGLRWFAEEVLPHLLARVPWARVVVTGGRPPSTVTALAGPAIRFVGQVADLSEVYSRARVVIVPMRFGSGVKLKVVEALLHGLPVVATSCGAEGINLCDQPAIDVADDPAEFAARLATLLEEPRVWDLRRATIANLVRQWEAAPARSWRSVIDGALDGRR